jgi:hypothetical protein
MADHAILLGNSRFRCLYQHRRKQDIGSIRRADSGPARLRILLCADPIGIFSTTWR